MPTPVHPTTTTGSLAELQVAEMLASIGWAPPAKVAQDIGDDLFTFARETVEFGGGTSTWDLAAPVFLQVKGSRKAYSAPTAAHAGERGWWFAEKKKYKFDHWLEFGLPYLLVLVDTAKRVAYWCEVDGKAIDHTKKRRRLFVPQAQTIDADHLAALNAVAVKRRSSGLTGLAWNGLLAQLPVADRLRYALTMPRVIAPHVNRSFSSLSCEEAIALILRGRGSDLLHRNQAGGSFPPLSDWSDHDEWGWRLAQAIRMVTSDGIDFDFSQLIAQAAETFDLDAARVVQAFVHHAWGRTDKALEILQPGPHTLPADLGWILSQRAAMLLELDRPSEAADAAKAALVAVAALEGDLSAGAIRGAAASTLYAASEIGASDLGEVLSAADNAGSWWRSLDIADSLNRELTTRFEEWSGATPTQFMRSTPIGDLRATAMVAGLAGSWGAWRHIMGQIAKILLTSSTEAPTVQWALEVLVEVGDTAAAKNGSRKIWNDGPVGALEAVAATLVSRPWPKRSEGATLALLGYGADLLDATAADRIIERVFQAIDDDGPTRRFAGGFTDRWSELPDVLTQALKAASPIGHEHCAARIIEHFADAHDGIAQTLVRANASLIPALLSEATLSKLVEVSARRTDRYRIDLLEPLAAQSTAAGAMLRELADNGSEGATRALLVAGAEEARDHQALGSWSAEEVGRRVSQATDTPGIQIRRMGPDPLLDLCMCAYHSHDATLWQHLVEALSSGALAASDLQQSVHWIACHWSEVPTETQNQLHALAPALRAADHPSTESCFEGAHTELLIATGHLSQDRAHDQLLELALDDPTSAARIAQVWNGPQKLTFLGGLAVHPEWQVRAWAVYGLVKHAETHPMDADAASKIVGKAIAHETGCRVVEYAAAALAETAVPAFDPLRLDLGAHPAATIRQILAAR